MSFHYLARNSHTSSVRKEWTINWSRAFAITTFLKPPVTALFTPCECEMFHSMDHPWLTGFSGGSHVSDRQHTGGLLNTIYPQLEHLRVSHAGKGYYGLARAVNALGLATDKPVDVDYVVRTLIMVATDL